MQRRSQAYLRTDSMVSYILYHGNIYRNTISVMSMFVLLVPNVMQVCAQGMFGGRDRQSVHAVQTL